MKITATIFAHIHNDPYLAGTKELQGSRFKPMVEFLAKYLTEHAGIGSTELAFSALSLDDIIYIEDQIIAAQEANYYEYRYDIHSTASAIWRKISDNLAANKSTFMPGGWTAFPSGHQMLYEFKLAGNIDSANPNDVILLIYNTGAGLNYHQACTSVDKDKACPVKTYRIPAIVGADAAKMQVFITSLITPKILPAQQKKSKKAIRVYNAKVLYEEVFCEIAYVGGVEVDATKYTKITHITPQRTGTCTQKSLNLLIRATILNAGFSVAEYKEFMYRYKKYSLYAYIDELKDSGETNNYGAYQQIMLAIENMARILNKDWIKDTKTINPTTELAELYELKQQVNAILQPLLLANKTSESNVTQGNTSNSAVTLTVADTTPPPAMNNRQLPINSQITHEYFTAIPPDVDLNSLLKELHATCYTLINTGDIRQAYTQLQALFLNLPSIPAEENIAIYNASIPTKEAAEIFFETMVQLKHQHNLCYNYLLGNTVAAENIIVTLNYMTIMNTVAKSANYCSITNDAECSLEDLSYLAIQGLLHYSRTNPYLATNDKILEERLLALRAYYKAEERKVHFILPPDKYYKYYQLILSKYPSVKVHLRTYYDQTLKSLLIDPRCDEALVKENICELYALFNLVEKAELQADFRGGLSSETERSDFNKLLRDFNLQDKIELAFASSWYKFMSPDYHLYKHELPGLGFSFFLSYGDASISLNSKQHHATYKIVQLNHELANSRRQILNSAVNAPLMTEFMHVKHNQKPATNLVQLNPKMPGNLYEKDKLLPKTFARKFVTADLLARELFHLRTASGCQIMATIDFFEENLNYLANPDFQTYFLLNMFEPGLLKQELELNHKLADKIINFIVSGLKYYQDNRKPSLTSVFFYKLYALCTNYLPIDQDALIMELTKQINYSNVACNVKRDLHVQRLLLISEQPVFEKYLSLHLESLLSIEQSNGVYQSVDIMEEYQLNQAIYRSSIKLQAYCTEQQNCENIIEQTSRIMVDIAGADVAAEKKVSLQYPMLTISDLIVNLSNGQVFKNGLRFCAPPLELKTDPLLKELFGENLTKVCATMDGNYFEFTHNTVNYRLIKKNNTNGHKSKFVLQREFSIDGTTSWYELQALGEMQLEHSAYLEQMSAKELQEIFKEKDNQAWVAVADQKTLLIVNRCSTVANYIYLADNANLLELDATGLVSTRKVLLPNSSLHNIVSKFEDPKFVIVTHDTANDEYFVNLPRYGLSLAATYNQDDSKWCLMLSATKQPAEFSQATLFLPAENMIILPVQEFIVDRSTKKYDFDKYREVEGYKGDDYAFKLDVSAEIQEHCLPGKTKLWQHSSTQRYFKYSIDLNNDLYADNVAANLYLAYTYLGRKQPAMAFNVLNKCIAAGGIIGEPKEKQEQLTFLQMIINSVPRRLDDSEDVTLNNPEYLAVKLKALYLLASFMQQGYEIDFPIMQAAKSDNDRYTCLQVELNKKFYRELRAEIFTCFDKFHNSRNNLPAEFNLTTNEELVLLNQYFHFADKPAGAMALYWHQLKAKQKQIFAASNGLIKSIKILSKRYLQQITVPVKLKSIFSINVHDPIMEKEPFKYFPTHALKSEAATIACRGNVTDVFVNPFAKREYLFREICYFYKIAIAQDESFAGLKQKLEELCTTIILAYRNNVSDKYNQNITEVCKLLYCVLKNSQLFASDKRFTEFSYGTKAEDFLSQLQSFAATLPMQKHALTTWEMTAVNVQGLADGIASVDVDQLAPYALNQEQRHLDSLLVTADFIEKLKKTSATAFQISEISEQPSGNRMDFSQRALQQIKLDNYAGTQINLAETSRKDLAIAFLSGESLAQIGMEISILIDKTTEELASSVGRTISLAKTEFQQPNGKLLGAYLSRKVLEPNIGTLLNLYLQNNQSEYAKATGLGTESIAELHSMLADYLRLAVKKQRYAKLLRDIQAAQQALNDKNNQKFAEAVDCIVTNLLEADLVDYTKENIAAIFQHGKKITIRQKQKEYLTTLLAKNAEGKFANKIIQLIMGGGKSKVLLPLLALNKATGKNLVIIEVPNALFNTNYTDLCRVTSELFGVKPFALEFSRDSDCDPVKLKQLYRDLQKACTERSYLVTTGESVQSLELKYLELLHLDVTDLTVEELVTHDKKIKWLTRIISCLRDRGDVLIDEVDSALNVRKLLNYTLGDGQAIPVEHIQITMQLYEFFAGIYPLTDIINDPDLISNPEVLTKALNDLAESLVNSPDSPIAATISRVFPNETDNTAILHYLTGKGQDIPVAVNSATMEDKTLLAIVREQLVNLLPLTLQRKMDEHYGKSKSRYRDVIAAHIAIPYLGNNTPNERCKFGNYLETINYTIQLVYTKGLAPELLLSLIKQWKAELNQQILQQKAATQQTTAIENIFAEITAGTGFGIKLADINLDNSEHVDHILATLGDRKNLATKKFTNYILREYILKQVCIDSKVLHSDPQNHVNIYNSVQGVTGTPWNYTTMHQDLSFDSAPSFGTDGITRGLLIKKETPIHAVTEKQPLKLFAHMLDKISSQDDVRAIIDIGAMFRGVDNENVARNIGGQLAAVKFVLYFNADNKLCAINTAAPGIPPILIGSSDQDVIDKILGCGPNERFTYYDQRHTIGTDIKQSPQAKAIVTVDKANMEKDLLQGVMRMRGFPDSQSIEVFLTADTIKDKKISNIKHVISFTTENQIIRLAEDNFRSALQKINNIVRHNFINKMLSCGKDINKQRKLFAAFKAYFVEQNSNDAFSKFGVPARPEKTMEALAVKVKLACTAWRQGLKTAGLTLEDADVKQVDAALENVLAQAKLNCNEYTLSSRLDAEQEVECQREVDLELDKEQQLEIMDAAQQDEAQLLYDWISRLVDGHAVIEHLSADPSFIRLDAMFTHDMKEQRNWRFSNNIFVSKNFYATTKGQNEYLDIYQKPVHAILLQHTAAGLRANIVTYEEAQLFKNKQFSTVAPEYIWLVTPKGTLLAGTPPEIKVMQTTEYLAIMEQVQFFAGMTNYLVNKNIGINWLLDNSEEKLHFFQQFLSAFRLLAKKSDLVALKTRLANLKTALYKIENYSLTKLKTIDISNEKILEKLAITTTDLPIVYAAIKRREQVLLAKAATLEMVTKRIYKPAGLFLAARIKPKNFARSQQQSMQRKVLS